MTDCTHRTRKAPPPERREDTETMTDDANAANSDATRPIVAPGDDRPDDPELIPTRHEEPTAAPRTAPAAGAPIYLDPADDDHDTNAELAARALEKAAYRAERAAQAQSAAPTDKTTPKDRGAPTAAPGRPQGTLRHPAWGDAGHQPSTGGRAPGNPPNQGSAGRHPPARVVYSGYNRGVADG